MRPGIQFDSGGVRARSGERALGLAPFSHRANCDIRSYEAKFCLLCNNLAISTFCTCVIAAHVRKMQRCLKIVP